MTALGIRHQPVQLRTLLFTARDTDIGIFTCNDPATPVAIFAQLSKLNFGVLAFSKRGNPLSSRVNSTLFTR